MKTLDADLLSEYLRNQRWFAGKGTPVKHVSLVETLDLSELVGRNLEIAVVQVTYELGLPERYFVPLRTDVDHAYVDAARDERVLRFLFSLIREGRRLESGAGALQGELIGQGAKLLAGIKDGIRPLNVEQTNSSVVLEGKVIFKVVRKLEAGLNPELEVGRFLASRTRFRATPPLLGALQLEGPVSATVGLVHEFIPSEGDGWKFVTQTFAAAAPPASAALAEMEAMGARIAQMHLALGSEADDPAFAPEPILQEDLQRWSSSIIGELGVTTALAMHRFPELEGRRPALLERAQRVAQLAPSGKKTRQHGDLHLGQLLRGRDGWMVIDFEGEPARSFDQRREKHTPLRDVAGMLRSFVYAAHVAKLPRDARLSAIRFAREFFLKGYRAKMQDSPLLPSSEDTLNVLLDALELEKALYEVRYELQTRPDWAHIPVESLLA